ncbi:UPF0481 protein At3g47200-like [Rhodamnia argentea]|uniref:UPF0481 protein At3g47200-like n=1 Tax=Rhodamnia argentea TaxID=178133 RepID=A0A8B8PBT9_9MYRT|nr:UPF0481 protein At3g47200-like [Rhodamnia argentea]
MAFIRNMLRVNLRKVRIAVSVRRKKSPSNAPAELIAHHHRQQQQPRDNRVHNLQQEPCEALRTVVENNGGKNVPEDEPRSPEPQWVVSIKEKLEQARQNDVGCSWEKLSIHRIPHYLKDGKGKDKAYVPQIVSLGPYHHGKERLRQMEQHKWRCLHRVLMRTNHRIGFYLDSVMEVEERARTCYEGPISMSSTEFVEMMVLDGCFVIELFQGVAEGFETLGYPPHDPVFSMRGPVNAIQRDMILLENQIPFLILNRLYGLQHGHLDQEGVLANLALQFFDPMKPTEPTDEHLTISSNRLESNPLPDHGELHCLELFRRSLLHPGPSPVDTKELSHKRQQLIHCVTELRQAGIKFSKGKTDRFWDIQFEGGSLQIPQLVIHDGTKSLFHNLIAFEQCHSNCTKDITSYVIFMDNLINSPKDIGHLHDRGIIEHWLGSNAEVADLFNQLCQEVVFDVSDSYLSTLSQQVNEYSSHSWYRWLFLLKNEYFGNPWSITSFIAAVVLLGLTFAQTFYAVYGYYRPGS